MVWRACERLGIRPPGVKENFDDCDVWTQAQIIGYNRLRQYEDAQELELLLKAGASRGVI